MASSWKTVRVFISSTFRDMHAERDYLVKVVFPRLREWCEERRLYLVDIDLRWGVTQAEAESGKAIEICLKEIDGSRPFFICLLGEQYGSISAGAQLPGPSLEHGDKSITHLEIIYAALNAQTAAATSNPGQAFFYFRDPASFPRPEELTGYLAAERDIYRLTYFGPAPAADATDSRRLLQNLKAEILRRFSAEDRVYRYKCRWDSEANNPTTPGLRGRIVGLELLGERLESDLKRGIEAQFRDHLAGLSEQLDPLEAENALHSEFIGTRTQLHVPDDDLQRAISAYTAGPSRKPCVLSGGAGAGKSAALAYWTETNVDMATRRSRADRDILVLFRSVGASPNSTRLPALLANLCQELAHQFGSADGKKPEDTSSAKTLQFPIVSEDPAEIVRAWPNFLRVASEISRGRIIILLDGINQLGGDANPRLASWIPDELPPNIRLLVSATELPDFPANSPSPQEHGNLADWLGLLRSRGLDEIRVKPLDDTHRHRIVRDLPSIFSKSLDAAQTEILLSNPATQNPLFLCVALQELRIFGSFERLEQAIASLPRPTSDGGIESAVDALFSAVLARLEGEEDRAADGLVMDLFSSLACARDGLSERELDALLVSAHPDASDSVRRGTLQSALRQVRPYLQRKQSKDTVLIDFFHASFREAARRRYVSSLPKLVAKHRELGNFFETRATVSAAFGTGGTSSLDHHAVAELAWQRLRVVALAKGSLDTKADETALLGLFMNWHFLEAKFEAGLVFELVQEIAEARQLASPHNPESGPLSLIEEALRREIHFLARHRIDYPQALFQTLWNACYWHDAPEAAMHFEQGDSASTCFDNRLAGWAERYRSARAAKQPEAFWLRQLRPPVRRLGTGLTMVFDVFRKPVRSIAYSPDGRFLLTGSSSPGVVVWDALSGEEIYRIERAGGRYSQSMFHRTENSLRSVSTVKSLAKP
jgi:hypothetical protein